MLRAVMKDGKEITLPASLTPEKISKIRKEQPYFCPCCSSPLILKAGDVKVPHFAHKSKALCNVSSEPESAYHLAGKRNLYLWLKRNGIKAQLEAYIPQIQQRADILFKVASKRYAIEFQCSAISEADMLNRTNAYVNEGIIPIWILAEKKMKCLDTQQYRFSRFLWLFVTGTTTYPFLWTYCPQKNNLHAYKGITSFSPNIVFAYKTSASLTILPYHKMSPKIYPQLTYLNEWCSKRINWCYYSTKTANLQNPLFRALYKRRVAVATLPFEIGIPVKGMAFIKTATVEWQCWLYLDVLYDRKVGQIVSIHQFERTYKKRLAMGHIKERNLPLLQLQPSIHPVKQYINCLHKAGYFKETTPGYLRILKTFTNPSAENYESAGKKFYYENRKLLEQGLFQ